MKQNNKSIMNNVSHNNDWNLGTVQVHEDPPPIPLIKINNDEKLDKGCVKIKLLREPESEKSDPYEFKMALFDNNNP